MNKLETYGTTKQEISKSSVVTVDLSPVCILVPSTTQFHVRLSFTAVCAGPVVWNERRYVLQKSLVEGRLRRATLGKQRTKSTPA